MDERTYRRVLRRDSFDAVLHARETVAVSRELLEHTHEVLERCRVRLAQCRRRPSQDGGESTDSGR